MMKKVKFIPIILAIIMLATTFSSCESGLNSDTSITNENSTKESGTTAVASTDKSDETSTVSETTTAAPETTKVAETTKAAPETTKVAETTTAAPETTKVAETTKAAPDTTKVAETTTAAPETTKVAETTTAAPETTGGESTDTFPKENFMGETLTVYAREASSYTQTGIYAEERSGEIINDTTFARNSLVEKRYNVKIKLKTTTNPSNDLKTDVVAGIVDYDLVLDQRSTLSNRITSGFLADWNTLGIDMTQPWWDINAKNGYEINGKCYLAVNDISTGNLSGTRFLYFGNELLANYKLLSPYEYVKNNNWTLDTFTQMVKAVSTPYDVNELGVYGMLRETGSVNGVHMHFITGCGIEYVRWEDGKLVNNIDDSAIQKLQGITDKLTQALTPKDSKFIYSLTYEDANKYDTLSNLGKYDKARSFFASGHFLFVETNVSVADAFKDMPQGFGVVPNPKYNTDQASYVHRVDRYSLIWAIPNVPNLDKDMIATVTDFWAYTSRSTVMEAYLELFTDIVKVDETKARNTLDIVKSTMYYDIGDLFDTGISSCINNGYNNGKMANAFSTTQKKTIDNTLKKINDGFAEMSK